MPEPWAATDAQKCQASKNKAAGKYAACRQNAEKGLALTGDTVKYGAAIAKCEEKFTAAWQKAIQKATDAGVTCLDAPLVATNYKPVIDEHCDNIATALRGEGLTDCSVDLATCSGSLATCNAGTAAVGDVLATKTFSSSAGLGVTGTMPNNGAVTLTPTTSDQTIAAGYHNGSGKCVGDTDLTVGNIKSGVNLFGVDGSVIEASGNAAAADVLTGKTFSNTSAAGLSGTMANVGQQNVTPGTAAVTITQGYHDGIGTVAGDADLLATNIKNGVNIFGVVGTLSGGGLPETGQTQCDQGAGTLGACPGSPAGQDGALLKGLTRSYTDHGDGTITDNVTGLMWEKLSNDGTIHDKDNRYTWYNAFNTKIVALNSSGGFAGHTDWRLPNRFELETLLDLGRVNPAIDPVFNTSCPASCTVLTCSCTQSSVYWSSTTYQSNPSLAWLVYFDGGGVSGGGKDYNYYVRAVRGGS